MTERLTDLVITVSPTWLMAWSLWHKLKDNKTICCSLLLLSRTVDNNNNNNIFSSSCLQQCNRGTPFHSIQSTSTTS